MKRSLQQSQASSREDVKSDPFVLADFDQLATEIIEELEKESINRERVKDLATKIKTGAESFTLFLIEAGLKQ